MFFPFFGVKEKKKVGLCLSGGGVKGLAHLGVLKAFEENGISFDMVSGTSVGSIVGSAYALGLKSDDIYEAALKIGFKDFFYYKDPKKNVSANKKVMDALDTAQSKGLKNLVMINPSIDSKTIEKILLNLYGDKTFEDTLIPFYAVAVDLKTGKEVVLDSGRLALACRASSSIPGVFTPTKANDMLLVDGFVLNNMPADVLKQRGCDIVISVNLKAYAKPGKDSVKYLDILSTTIDIMAYASLLSGIASSDIVIAPDLDDSQKPYDLSDNTMKSIYTAGYEAAMEKMPEIIALLKKNRVL